LLIEEPNKNVIDLIYNDLNGSDGVLQGNSNANLANQKTLFAHKSDLGEDWPCFYYIQLVPS